MLWAAVCGHLANVSDGEHDDDAGATHASPVSLWLLAMVDALRVVDVAVRFLASLC